MLARANVLLEIAEHALAELLDVGRTLAQIGVLHQIEVLDVLLDHLPERTLRPLAAADQPSDLPGERAVVEHVQVGVEERALLGVEAVGELLAERPDVRAHRLDGTVEHQQLDRHVARLAVGHRIEVRRRIHHHAGADRHAGGAGDPDEARVLALRAPRARLVDRADDLGVRDHAGELRRERDQERLLGLVEAPRLGLLHDQHAEHAPMVDDRDPEERVERLLADLGQIAVVGMARRRLEIDRLRAQAHQAHEALGAPERETPHHLLVQPLGRREDEALARGVGEVDRADLGAHRRAHAPHDDPQRARQVRRRVDVLDDAAQRVERRHRISSRGPGDWARARASPGGRRRA